MTPEDAVPILARMVTELQADLADARKTIAHLIERAEYADQVRWWMQQHEPAEVLEMAAELV